MPFRNWPINVLPDLLVKMLDTVLPMRSAWRVIDPMRARWAVGITSKDDPAIGNFFFSHVTSISSDVNIDSGMKPLFCV